MPGGGNTMVKLSQIVQEHKKLHSSWKLSAILIIHDFKSFNYLISMHCNIPNVAKQYYQVLKQGLVLLSR